MNRRAPPTISLALCGRISNDLSISLLRNLRRRRAENRPVDRTNALPKITWHIFASRLTGDGGDLVTVKDLLGHSNISTTLRYAHSSDEAKRRAVDKLATVTK
jgi:integrase/recombinase XerD